LCLPSKKLWPLQTSMLTHLSPISLLRNKIQMVWPSHKVI
jgi:hypothetical protein